MSRKYDLTRARKLCNVLGFIDDLDIIDDIGNLKTAVKMLILKSYNSIKTIQMTLTAHFWINKSKLKMKNLP